jgi:hypothetical protein
MNAGGTDSLLQVVEYMGQGAAEVGVSPEEPQVFSECALQEIP